MKKNLGSVDRWIRIALALAMAGFGLMLPLPVMLGLDAAAVMLLGTAFSGHCLAYRLMGHSTCPR
ncbi:MAG: DUF2892 domain-containing protein [Kofleriaceae bacterium]